MGRLWLIVDVTFSRNVAGPIRSILEDDQQFMKLIVSLADEMKAVGIEDETAQKLGNFFRAHGSWVPEQLETDG